MRFWRPAYATRGCHGYWFDSASLMECQMSERAARAIYRCFNLIPDMPAADNDRDALRW